jgi:uncharacterized membrane protein SpoIIM required for sporulation
MKEILKKRSWKVYAFMLFIFFFFFFFSYLSSKYLLETEPEKVEEMLKQIMSTPAISRFQELLKQEKYVDIAFLIFFHNSQLALLNYFFGIGFLFAIIIQASNGFLLGFLLAVSEGLTLTEALAIFIVLLLELTALTATAVEGMYLTYSYIRPERMWKTKSRVKSIKKTFSQSIRIILLCLLLLLLSAIIETLFIYHQTSSIKPIIIGV